MLNKPLVKIGLSLTLVLSLTIVFNRLSVKPVASTQDSIEWLQQPKSVNDFTLISATGRFSNTHLKDHWTIIVFGYISCPDVCPTSLFELSLLAKKLEQEQILQNLNYVFVSVDPQRDTLANITQYVSYFHPDFIGVTGSLVALESLTQSIGIRFSASELAGSYTVSHSVYFSIIAPDGRLYGRFKPNFDVEKLAQELKNVETANESNLFKNMTNEK
ncbi:cytochrome c oxidase assembly protein [Thalassotalea insulae]|uniref:Cytochrome c oxidase assembly protein n=2 Tax=Thalassotalea insulae TaxID=2056778 RepID=A0ABQ6GUR3_9GAMM|nr:cytochrome c oxidase assembly protein [Thalassotalea insulae]